MTLTEDVPLYITLTSRVLEIGSFVLAIGLGLRAQGKASAVLDAKIENVATTMEVLKDDIKVLNKLVSEVAVTTSRLDTLGRQIERLERRQDELRHGDGFVRGPSGVDKEY